MADKDSEQNIDRLASNSPIDQITKIPTSKPKAKVKNPKRVAAGKKLSEYNKKAKEQQKLIQENDEEENHNNNDDRWLPKTSFSSIIALVGLGLTALDLFLRHKNRRDSSKIYENPVENPVEQIDSDADKINVSIMKHNVGME